MESWVRAMQRVCPGPCNAGTADRFAGCEGAAGRSDSAVTEMKSTTRVTTARRVGKTGRYVR